VIPVLTPEQMAGVDAGAAEPVEVLIGRAGAAVARHARRLLGSTYGTRIVVVAGKGNNGADGRAAARLLRRQGAAVVELEATEVGPGGRLPTADLVIDAAYGTGLRGPYAAPDPGAAPVLSVDIPSGVSGLTGEVAGEGSGPGHAVVAEATVTFAALKPGHLLGEGPDRCGAVEVADIGLGAGVKEVADTWLVTDADVIAGLPRRTREAHKWQTALRVVAGSPGMTGAAWLVSTAAMRAGAGYVRLGVPGTEAGDTGLPPSAIVVTSLPPGPDRAGGGADGGDWVDAVLSDLRRFRALVVGPGLGSAGHGAGGDLGATSAVGRLVRSASVPLVIDADGLNALGSLDALSEVTAGRDLPCVITPHDGEYTRLAGRPPGPDRIASAREAARRSGAVVLLKGSATVVAEPSGKVLIATAGSSRLATAGTGDALSGVIGAFLARGLGGAEAAAFAAHVHGRAAADGRAEGLVATDLPDLISAWLSRAQGSPAQGSPAPAVGDSVNWYGEVRK
jgi:ADP-dependent NAD(P)H-hydrate dehydratase / NAD(P)H-hydrate epimerase